MPIPSNRTPVRVARGAAVKFTETIDGVAGAGAKELQDGEIVWDETNEKFQIKYGGSTSTTLKDHTVDTTGLATLTGADFTGPITVGVDDTGHDVKFFGATSGKYCLWDESQNLLEIEGGFQVNDNNTGTFKGQASFEGQVNFIQTSGDQHIVQSGPVVFGKTVTNIGFKPALKLDYGVFEAYWQGDKKLETTTSGVTVTGDVKLGDDDYLKLGDSDDLSVHHVADGGTFIVNNAALYTRGTELYFQEEGDSNKEWIHCLPAGSVELSYDNSKKFETTDTGVKVTGAAVPASITALSYSGTSSDEIDINFNANNNFSLTTAHAATKFVVPTNAVVAGQSGSIFITQGSTTCATPIWSTQFVFSTGAAPSFTATEDKVARIDYIVQTGQAASGTEAKIHCVATDDLAATPQ